MPIWAIWALLAIWVGNGVFYPFLVHFDHLGQNMTVRRSTVHGPNWSFLMHSDDIMMPTPKMGVGTPPGTWSRDPGSGVPGDQIWGPPPRAIFASMRLFGPSDLDPLFRGFMPFLGPFGQYPQMAKMGPQTPQNGHVPILGSKGISTKNDPHVQNWTSGVENPSGSRSGPDQKCSKCVHFRTPFWRSKIGPRMGPF